MAYTAIKNSSGTYDVSLNGSKVATGTSAILGNYGLSESSLSGSTPTTNAVNNSGQGIYVGNPSLNPQFSYPAPQQAVAPAPVAPAPTATAPSSIPMSGGYTAQAPQQTPQQNQPTQQAPGGQTNPNQMGQTPVFNGSIVDLLNSAGQDSSYQARAALAKQYGIGGYAGTAAQNVDLAKKYLSAYDANKGGKTPETGAQAKELAQSFFDSQDQSQSTPEAEKSFFEQYLSMNPAMKSMYDSISNYFSASNVKTSLADEYSKLMTDAGVPQLQTDLMNMKRVMAGTEDDIRDEIGKVGGFATESQVLALTGARNKVLLKQAQGLQDQLTQKEDYIDHIMTFTQADRAQLDKDISTKLGIFEKMTDMEMNMKKAAQDSWGNTLKAVGFDGLASLVKENPTAERQAESALGLPKGALQNEALIARIAKQNDKVQFVSGTANQPAGFANLSTQTFTPLRGGGSGGSGSGGGAQTNDPLIKQVVNTLRQSLSNPTKTQLAVIDSIASSPNPFAAVRNQAQNVMGQTLATSISQKEIAGNQLESLAKDLKAFYNAGGSTDYFKGNLQFVINRLGEVTDPKLVELATQIETTLQSYRNAISGTAYSAQEGKDISYIFPGINKTEGLNDAILAGRKKSIDELVNAAYDNVIGQGVYEQLKKQYAPQASAETSPYFLQTNAGTQSSGSIPFNSITNTSTVEYPVGSGKYYFVAPNGDMTAL